MQLFWGTVEVVSIFNIHFKAVRRGSLPFSPLPEQDLKMFQTGSLLMSL